MDQMTDRMKFVARRLADIHAVQFSEYGFRLWIHEEHPGAPLSPFYIDLRRLRSYPRLLSDVAGLMVEARPAVWEGLDLISDVPVASPPFVPLISQRTAIPMISPRLTSKSHGLGGEILGVWQPGQRVGIIDDLRTTGGSKEQVIALYEKNGLKVTAVMAFVDRGNPEGADVAGKPFFSTYGWSWLLGVYRQAGIVALNAVERAERYPTRLTEHIATCKGCA